VGVNDSICDWRVFKMKAKYPIKKEHLFDKTIIDMWEKNGITYLISIDDNNILYITERPSEVVK
jgi:hypothetical protein